MQPKCLSDCFGHRHLPFGYDGGNVDGHLGILLLIETSWLECVLTSLRLLLILARTHRREQLKVTPATSGEGPAMNARLVLLPLGRWTLEFSQSLCCAIGRVEPFLFSLDIVDVYLII